MLNAIGTAILALACVALGMAVSEWYHARIDEARRDALPHRWQLHRPQQLWDLSKPAPTPQPIVSALELRSQDKRGQFSKLMGGGRHDV